MSGSGPTGRAVTSSTAAFRCASGRPVDQAAHGVALMAQEILPGLSLADGHVVPASPRAASSAFRFRVKHTRPDVCHSDFGRWARATNSTLICPTLRGGCSSSMRRVGVPLVAARVIRTAPCARGDVLTGGPSPYAWWSPDGSARGWRYVEKPALGLRCRPLVAALEPLQSCNQTTALAIPRRPPFNACVPCGTRHRSR